MHEPNLGRAGRASRGADEQARIETGRGRTADLVAGNLDRAAVLVGDEQDDVLLRILAESCDDVRGLIGGADEFDSACDLGNLAVLDEGGELTVDIEYLEVVEGSLTRRTHGRIRSRRSVLGLLTLTGIRRRCSAHAEVILAGLGAQAGLCLEATTRCGKLRGFVDRCGSGFTSLFSRGGHIT